MFILKVNTMWKNSFPVFYTLMVFGLLQLYLPLDALAEFEKPGVLKASSLLQPAILKGEHYSVDEQVKNDGMFNHYTVTSQFGKFKAASTNSLHILINEIKAIAAMRKVETDDTALASLKQSGENTVTGVQNLINDPQATLEGAAAGVGSLFNRAKETVGKRQVSEAEDSKVEQLIGLSKSKGEVAVKYGVNMYSRNQILQDELNRLAKADYVGGLGIGVATSVVPGAGGFLLATSGTARLLNEVINTTPASELWLQNKNKLLTMGVEEDTAVLFLNNPSFSPAMSTVLVAALESLQGAANRDLYVMVALQASDPDMARVITETAVLTAGYHKNIAPLKQLVAMARLARAEKKDGTIVVVLPTDYIIWSRMAADVATLLGEERKSPADAAEVWITGDFSPMARSKLEGMGYKLHPKAQSRLIPPQK